MPVYSLTILAAAALVVWVYQHDRYEKEPWYAVVAALLVGFCAMWLIGRVDGYALRVTQLAHDQIVAKAALIAGIEELGKLLTVLVLARVLLVKQFNDPMDGLIYGRLMGLGMAVEESLLYLSLAPATFHTLGMEIVRLFAHSLMGGLIGFAVGIGARPGQKRQIYPGLVIGCLALSTLLHFGWNVVAYAEQSSLIHRILPMVIMLTMMLLWRWLCGVAEAKSRAIFADPTGACPG